MNWRKLLPTRDEWAGVLFLAALALMLIVTTQRPKTVLQGVADGIIVIWFGMIGLGLQRRP